ncbi:MAG: hypothetical protein ETSY1_06830 [Candidatus Entotheonella factor]|uniref:Uncharacterized protein n=1 Tax=Entotheonella factor TaxID=1429438 RepID=W4LW32_ENTF1|nr:MAG: hypothetical protein ETSY1_06830 [Candidatus Entotheonella factor]
MWIRWNIWWNDIPQGMTYLMFNQAGIPVQWLPSCVRIDTKFDMDVNIVQMEMLKCIVDVYFR